MAKLFKKRGKQRKVARKKKEDVITNNSDIGMSKFGCAPIYLFAAILFFIVGGILVSYQYYIIGAIVIVPGIFLLGLMFLTLSALSQFKQGKGRVVLRL